MLAGQYRALDLTDVKGAFCGRMLAELGVDVVKVEPPGGSNERRFGPFYHDQPHPERSLCHFAYNVDKRGVTLNLATADGRAIFRRLAARADFVLESFPPDYLDRLGIGYAALSADNPRLILTSITPFGQTGPWAHYAADDLTVLALGGLLNLNGDPDRPPLRFSVEQSFPQAGAQAAAATMIAHEYRARSGHGQHIDVSMQEAISEAIWMQAHFWDIERTLEHREGVNMRRGAVGLPVVFPCQDGYVSWRIFVATMGGFTRALAVWLAEEGMAGSVAEVDWKALDMHMLRQDDIDRWCAEFGAFFMKHTKAELHEGAHRRGIMLFPVNDPSDLLRDPQLAARDFWTAIEHPELNATIRYTGRPYLSTAIGVPPKRRAPLLGEHNRAVYCGELGLSPVELVLLKENGVI